MLQSRAALIIGAIAAALILALSAVLLLAVAGDDGERCARIDVPQDGGAFGVDGPGCIIIIVPTMEGDNR